MKRIKFPKLLISLKNIITAKIMSWFLVTLYYSRSGWPIPVVARSKAWVCGRSLAGIAGSNPAVGIDLCSECRVLSRRGIGPITRPKESYRVWCV